MAFKKIFPDLVQEHFKHFTLIYWYIGILVYWYIGILVYFSSVIKLVKLKEGDSPCLNKDCFLIISCYVSVL